MERPAQEPAFPAVVYVEGDLIDWWRPARSGDDATDYQSGAVTFKEAQLVAARNGAFGLMCSFVLGMKELQAFELGFLDALAAAAVNCRAPCLYTDEHVAEQYIESNGGLSIEHAREGNQQAWLDRQQADAEVVTRQLLKFVQCHPDPILPAYLHSISLASVRCALMVN